MASRYINDVEIKKALDRYEKKEVLIIPIIVRPTDFSSMEISKFQALPKDGKPISTWRDRDEAWLDVVKQLKRVFKSFNDGKIPLKKRKSTEQVATAPREDAKNDKLKIQNLVAKSKIKEALQHLLEAANSSNNDDLSNATLLLTTRFNSLKKNELRGIISFSDASVNRAQIVNGLLSLLEEL